MKQLDVIIHPCPNFNAVEYTTWIIEYISLPNFNTI